MKYECQKLTVSVVSVILTDHEYTRSKKLGEVGIILSFGCCRSKVDPNVLQYFQRLIAEDVEILWFIRKMETVLIILSYKF